MTRAAAAVLAVAAYALPAALGLLADLGHDVHHLAEEVREHRRMAAALGLVHLHEQGPTAPEHAPVPAAAGRFVHSHGGSAHAHDAATDALLLAAQQADEGADDAQRPTVKLSSHVPVASPAEPPPAPGVLGSPVLRTVAPASRHTAPTPPPPRA